MDGDLPLRGLKVLDLSRLLPGPYATLVLADLGAAVDKVEDPRGGDYLRQMPPQLEDEGALYYGLNRNKRSITLDLKSPQGVALLRRLVRSYDVLVESFRPGVMDKLGLGYAALSVENPRLVYCALSGYGQTGPDRLKAGHDLNYAARAGFVGNGGTAEGPGMPGGQVADVGGALFALVGILAALQERQRTGRGRLVDVALCESATAFLHMHLAARLVMGDQGAPLRRGHDPLNGGYACYATYRTRDGRYLSVGSLEPKFFSALCERLGREDLFAPSYDTQGGGAEQARAQLAEIFAGRTLAEWREHLSGLDACVEPVSEGDEVFADPQLRARGMFVPATDPTRNREVTHLRTPLHLGPLPVRPPPKLGEHTQEILREAGIEDSAL